MPIGHPRQPGDDAFHEPKTDLAGHRQPKMPGVSHGAIKGIDRVWIVHRVIVDAVPSRAPMGDVLANYALIRHESPAENDFIRGLLWWVPGCLVFFRHGFTSGFDQITGDVGDTRMAIYLHEHWVEVLRGHASWTSPDIFYPVKGALGYTDTYLLNEVFYLPLRAAGLDPFLAFQWTLILLSGVGFVGMFVLPSPGTRSQ